MSSKILMPALSPTMTEGTINKWLVKIGDNVKAGDIIAEIETDKATMEVEAVDEGKITHILKENPNNQVPVNTVIAIIDGKESDSLEDNLVAKEIVRDEKEQIDKKSSKLLNEKNDTKKNAVTEKFNNKIKASPFVKKIAKEQLIDLNQMKKTTPKKIFLLIHQILK